MTTVYKVYRASDNVDKLTILHETMFQNWVLYADSGAILVDHATYTGMVGSGECEQGTFFDCEGATHFVLVRSYYSQFRAQWDKINNSWQDCDMVYHRVSAMHKTAPTSRV